MSDDEHDPEFVQARDDLVPNVVHIHRQKHGTAIEIEWTPEAEAALARAREIMDADDIALVYEEDRTGLVLAYAAVALSGFLVGVILTALLWWTS